MAGESAERVAQASREKAEHLLHRAEMFEKGAEGERVVKLLLDALPPEWTVLHDLHWPGRPRVYVDHLVIGPGGVFVIDTKNWSGNVTISDGVLRQNGRARTAAVEGVRAAAAAVAGMVPSISPDAFVPVLCFVGDVGIHANLDGVLTCRADSLITMLRTRTAVLTPESLEFVRFELDVSADAPAESSEAPVLRVVEPPRAIAADGPGEMASEVPAPASTESSADGLAARTASTASTAPGRHRGPVRPRGISGVVRRMLLGSARH